MPPAPGPITAIREHPRRAGRYLLEIDQKRAATVSVEAIAELKLKVGVHVDASLLARVLAADEQVRCFDRALDALARRARSTRELERWLAAREHTAGAIENALTKLAELGLLDDAKYAADFAQSRVLGRGMGRRRVAAELARRGIPRDAVDVALAGLGEDGAESERGRLEEVAAKKWRTLRALDPAVATRRIYGFLARRGYAPGEIRVVVERLKREG